MSDDVARAVQVIRERAPGIEPRLAVVLGSGLGGFADAVEGAVAVSYADLPGFPRPGVAGHAGRLVLGRMGETPVAVLAGRAHYYESGRADAMKVPVRTLAALGCETLVLTNAAGSLNAEAGPGSVMVLTDHINMTGVSPLFGEETNARFVDMVDAYDPPIRRRFLELAERQGLTLHQGVYGWFSGPNFETPAEIRALRVLGGDAVGMSTVPEVIAARHAGMRVGALSIVTNLAAGMGDTRLSHEETIANAAKAADAVTRLLTAFVREFGP